MREKKMAEKKVEPIFKLPPEMIARMKTTGEDIDKAEKAVKVMKDLGMDVAEMEERLTWAKKVRETLLKEFA
uniref:Uncharacterized protein n=1 Tax=viral metagenome TaxID=1070528 RepID=A0A6H1ZP69_9ZZZZ